MSDLWTCVWDTPRPHIHPLRAPNGDVLTVDAPADHPWHHGLWFTIKFVNGENFWEEYGEFGTLETRSVEEFDNGVRAEVDWVRPDGNAVVLREIRTITETVIDGGYELRWVEELTPVVDVELDRTPFTTWGGYGGLTLRGAPDWADTTLSLPDGSEHDRLLGETATSCTLHGTTPSGTRASVTITPDTEHVRAPVPWYGSNRAATYGEGWANFLNAAFLWNDALTVAANTTLRLAYRIAVISRREDE